MAVVTPRKLRFINLGVGIFQLVTGVVLLAISDYNERGKLPWYTFFIASWTREDGQAASFYVPVPKKVVNFPIGVWSGAFLLLSAADHLTVTLPFFNRIYNEKLCLNRNPFRWIEYSVSASIMMVMIAQLCGITEIQLLFSIAFLMGTTMLFGWLMELQNGAALGTYELGGPSDEPKAVVNAQFLSENNGPATAARVEWLPFIFGCVPFMAATVVIACFFFQAVVNGDPPGFVWSIFFILFALYTTFAINQVLQFARVRGWRGFARAELWYILLSLTSKQLLAWINYGGTQRFQSE